MNYKFLKQFLLPLLVILSILALFDKFPIWVILILFTTYISLLILGSIYIGLNFYLHSICSVDEFPEFENNQADDKFICLTFDDGIHPVNTPKTLEILKKKNVKAHFFLIGKNIIGNEAILRKMHEDNHVIGNHSYWHHWNFDLQSGSIMAKEIEKTNQIVEKNIGKRTTLFRPPYGVTNPNLAKAINENKMISMGWNVRSMDTVAKSKEQLLNKLKNNTKPNAVILLHERCDTTIEVLTEYIDYCQAQGYKFVTLNV